MSTDVDRRPDRTVSGLHVAPNVTLPLDLLTQSSAILAMRGAGKTNAVMVLIEESMAAGVPVVTIDPKGDHWGIRAGADGTADGGLPLVVIGGLHGDVPLDPGAGKALADLIRTRRLSAVLDVSELTTAERTQFLTAFAEQLYRRPERENLLLVLEEAHEYIPQQARGDEVRMVGAFERLTKLGRFKGLAVVMVTQRSASLHKGPLSQTDNLFLMRTKAPQDRAAAKAWLTSVDDAAALTNALPRLADGETLLLQSSSGEPVRFTWRLRSTYDAGRTPKIGEMPRPVAALADVDLAEIIAAIGAPSDADNPGTADELRATVAGLREQLRAAAAAQSKLQAQLEQQRADASAERASHAAELAGRPAVDVDAIRAAITRLTHAIDVNVASDPPAPAPRAAEPAPAPAPAPQPKIRRRQDPPAHREPVGADTTEGADVALRKGARRMVEVLGAMHPLRVTKAQWGTLSKLRTSGGTWATYLSDIRRAGLLEESPEGYTLTDTGFDYLGGRPPRLDPAELREHYRHILRAGAVKMLDALVDAYPDALTREQLAAAAELAVTGGTFSTYLSDLTRNGLAERRGDRLRVADILLTATP